MSKTILEKRSKLLKDIEAQSSLKENANKHLITEDYR